jgi:catalase (peroxidase I)
MLQPTKRDVDEAWQAWLEIDLAIPVQACEAANDALSPLTATRLIAHLRFSTMCCRTSASEFAKSRSWSCSAARRSDKFGKTNGSRIGTSCRTRWRKRRPAGSLPRHSAA